MRNEEENVEMFEEFGKGMKCIIPLRTKGKDEVPVCMVMQNTIKNTSEKYLLVSDKKGGHLMCDMLIIYAQLMHGDKCTLDDVFGDSDTIYKYDPLFNRKKVSYKDIKEDIPEATIQWK